MDPSSHSRPNPNPPDRAVRETPGAPDFEALYERCAPLVWTLCRRILRDAEDAQDAFQSAWCRIASREDAAEFPDEAGLPGEAAIRRIAIREADALRKRRSRRSRREIAIEGIGEAPAPGRDLAGEADREAVAERVRALIDSLPERERLPLALHFFQEMSRVEIGEAIGAPVRTVSGRIERGLRRLEPGLRRMGITAAPGLLAGALLDPPDAMVRETARLAGEAFRRGPFAGLGGTTRRLRRVLASHPNATRAGAALLLSIVVGAHLLGVLPLPAALDLRRPPGPAGDRSSPGTGDVVTFFGGIVPGVGPLPLDSATSDLARRIEREEMTRGDERTGGSFRAIGPLARFEIVVDFGQFQPMVGLYSPSDLKKAGLVPGTLAWSVEAVRSAVPLFDGRVETVGSVVEIELAATDLDPESLAFVILPNCPREDFLAHPEEFSPKGGHVRRLPLFSNSEANPGGYDQALVFEKDGPKGTGLLVSFEDMSREPPRGGVWPNSNENFDDLAFSVRGLATATNAAARASSDGDSLDAADRVD